MSKHLEKVQEIRQRTDRHYNCAQSVLVAFAGDIGLDEETAYKVAANFGGGMKTGSVCGAISGGLMVLGMCGKEDPASVHKLFDTIKEKHEGFSDCKDLLKNSVDRGIPRKVHCDGLVDEIVIALEEMLG